MNSDWLMSKPPLCTPWVGSEGTDFFPYPKGDHLIKKKKRQAMEGSGEGDVDAEQAQAKANAKDNPKANTKGKAKDKAKDKAKEKVKNKVKNKAKDKTKNKAEDDDGAPKRPTFTISIVSKSMCKSWHEFVNPGHNEDEGPSARYAFSFWKALRNVQAEQRLKKIKPITAAEMVAEIRTFKDRVGNNAWLQILKEEQVHKPSNVRKTLLLERIMRDNESAALRSADKTKRQRQRTTAIAMRTTSYVRDTSPSTHENSALKTVLVPYIRALQSENLTLLGEDELLTPRVLSRMEQISQVWV